MSKIVHLSTVHEAIDNRILHKECRSLAEHGYDVTLIAQHPGDEELLGVKVVGLKPPTGRIQRLSRTIVKAVWKALKTHPDLVHFHDPELMLAAPVFRLLRIPVIYDVHEDYVTSIRDKSYLGWFRFPLSLAIALLEWITRRYCHVIIAERSYKSRFANGTMVLNYPRSFPAQPESACSPATDGPPRVLFTGGIHPNRGALNHAKLVNLHPDLEVHLVGRIEDATKQQLLDEVGDSHQRLVLDGGQQLVPFEQIIARYGEGNWIAGLAIFHRSADHYGKELTKFFEYMSAGIPILCSDFPVWRSLVEKHECGICVDPDNPQEMQEAVEFLATHPKEVSRMSANGRAAAGQYTWNSQADKMVRLYASILDPDPSPIAMP